MQKTGRKNARLFVDDNIVGNGKVLISAFRKFYSDGKITPERMEISKLGLRGSSRGHKSNALEIKRTQ